MGRTVWILTHRSGDVSFAFLNRGEVKTCQLFMLIICTNGHGHEQALTTNTVEAPLLTPRIPFFMLTKSAVLSKKTIFDLFPTQVSTNGFLTFGTSYTWPVLIPEKMMLLAYGSHIDVTSTSAGNHYSNELQIHE